MSASTSKTPAAPFKRLGRDLWLVVGIALSVWVLLALATYDANDPAWFFTGINDPAKNLMGDLGALVSEFMLIGFGYLAFVLPVLIVWHALSVLRERALVDLSQTGGWIRFLGWWLALAGFGGLLSVGWFPQAGDLPPEVTAGGALGQVMADLMLSPMGFVGGGLALFALGLAGLTLAFAIRWSDVFEWMGRNAEQLSQGIVGKAQARPQSSMNLAESKFERWMHPLQSAWSRFQSRRVAKAAAKKAQPAPAKEKSMWFDEPVLDDSPLDYAEPSLTGLDDLEWDPVVEDPIEIPPVQPANTEQRVEPVFDDPAVSEPAPAESVFSEPEPPFESPVPVTAFDPKEVGVTPDVDVTPTIGDKPRQTGFKLPGLELMIRRDSDEKGYSMDELQGMGELLEQRLGEFNVKAKVVEVHPGPVVTRFEIQPAPGVKASRISNLAQDLARSLAVARVRVVEVIPGKSVVGVEIPNAHRRIIRMREVVASEAFNLAESPLSLALGHDISGEAVVANVAKMPHLLVAGTTGSGKSVGINSMLVSMLYKAGPDEVRLILVDPKMLELSVYEGIPHLLAPVVTDMKEAANALRWCVGEMERRYKLMAKVGVRNLAGFNKKVVDAREAGEPLTDPLWTLESAGVNEHSAPELDTLPMIVVVIDEFADMMMIVGKKVDQLIARIAQKARAAGIHLILATQRPSVDVITGLIKANVPTRISFQVSSKIDSRTVLDQGGAEQLLGHGDMLFLPPGTSLPVRVHGCLVEDDEVHRVVEHWKTQGEPDLIPDILSSYDESEGGSSEGGGEGGNAEESDPLYDQAVEFVLESRRASISAVQRKLKIGYNRSARMIEAMEAAGVVSSMGHNGQREVIAPKPRSHD